MDKIDLHGIKHNEVEDVMINACHMYCVPFIVVTGNSKKMKKIVTDIVFKHFGLKARPSISNDGCLVIEE